MRDEHPDNKALLGQVAAVHGHRSDAEIASLPGISRCRPLGVVRPQGCRNDACTEQFRSDASRALDRGGVQVITCIPRDQWITENNIAVLAQVKIASCLLNFI